MPVGAATAASSIRTALPIIFFAISTPLILIFDKNIDRLFPNKNAFAYIGLMLILSTLGISIIYQLLKHPDNVISILRKLANFFGKKKKSRMPIIFDKFSNEIRRFSDHSIIYFSGNKKYVFLSITFTLLFLFTLFMFPVLLIKDLNPEALGMEIIFSQIVITSVMYFAPTPGASGVAEAAFILLFSNYVSQGDIVSLTFAWRLFTTYVGVGIGMVVFYIQLFSNGDKKHTEKIGV